MRAIHTYISPEFCQTQRGPGSLGTQTVLVLCDDKLGRADEVIREKVGMSTLSCPICQQTHFRLAAASDLSKALCGGTLHTVEPLERHRKMEVSLVDSCPEQTCKITGQNGRGKNWSGSTEERYDRGINSAISESLLKWASARETNACTSAERNNAKYRAGAYRRAALEVEKLAAIRKLEDGRIHLWDGRVMLAREMPCFATKVDKKKENKVWKAAVDAVSGSWQQDWLDASHRRLTDHRRVRDELELVFMVGPATSQRLIQE